MLRLMACVMVLGLAGCGYLPHSISDQEMADKQAAADAAWQHYQAYSRSDLHYARQKAEDEKNFPGVVSDGGRALDQAADARAAAGHPDIVAPSASDRLQQQLRWIDEDLMSIQRRMDAD